MFFIGIVSASLREIDAHMTKKIILDTDPGIDDAMAILFAEAHPDIELMGITTVYGNATIDNATHNALYLKQKFGMNAIVAKGRINL